MKKEKLYRFVPKKKVSPYMQRCKKILEKLCKNLQGDKIIAKFFVVGSGKRHLVTQLVENEKEHPFDLDFNLEIEQIPHKSEELQKLKEKIRIELNNVLREYNENFNDAQDSTSAISVQMENSSGEIEFSFDLGIISRNKNDDFQRLIHDKQKNLFHWDESPNSKNWEEKADKLRSKAALWNELRNTYLKKKNQWRGDKENHPSFVLFIEAVNEIYAKKENLASQKMPKEKSSISDKDFVVLLCEKICALKFEKRPKRIRTIEGFVKSLEKWKKIRHLLNGVDFSAVPKIVFEQLKSEKKLSVIPNSKKVVWFNSPIITKETQK